jgi:hypothetical protein
MVYACVTWLTRDALWQLIVALVLVNVVIAVLLDEFSKAAEKTRGVFISEDPETERYIHTYTCTNVHVYIHITVISWCMCISIKMLGIITPDGPMYNVKNQGGNTAGGEALLMEKNC